MERIAFCVATLLGLGILAGNVVAMRRPPQAQAQPIACPECKGPEVVLWGDSFAGAWEPYAERLAREKNTRAVRLGAPGCAPVVGMSVPIRGMKVDDVRCREIAEQAYAYIRTHRVDTLIVTARWARILHDKPEAASGVLEWARALPRVRRIVVVGAQPELRDDIATCLRDRVPCDIPREQYERDARPAKRMTAALSSLPNVEVLEFGDWLCDAEKCPGVRDGMVLYSRDNHHVSREAVGGFLSIHD